MFDIGIMETMIVLIIALLVIGPERMPEVARKIGRWMGKMRRFINTMKDDSEFTSSVRDLKTELQDSMNIEDTKKSLQSSLDDSMSPQSSSVDMEEFHNPFGSDTRIGAKNQFNKAPSQHAQAAPVAQPEQTTTPVSAEPEPVKQTQTIAETHSDSQPQPSATPSVATIDSPKDKQA